MEEAYRFLQNEIKSDGQTIVVAVSGGADSMAALHLLLKLRDVIDINLICAHINHNVRVESKKEEEELEHYCNQHKVIFESMTIEQYSNSNFESEARGIRYNFFEKIIKKYKATYLVTAHHGDDLIETILMRLVRGSTFKGYAGFSKVVDKETYKIIRPLINVTKEDILKYNHINNISYATDESNSTDEHTRNRYRKYVLPFLKKEDSNVNERFLRFSQKIFEYSEYVDSEMAKIICDIYNHNKLNIDRFLSLGKVMQDRIINHIMETIYLDDLTLITDAHTSLIMDIVTSSKPNVYICLPNNIRVIRSYQTLSFEQGKEEDNSFKIELSEVIGLPNGKTLEIVEDNDDKSNFTCRLDSKELVMPLYVRSKLVGDIMEVKGMSGHKKIKDIFIDEKVSANERDKWPILVDSKGEILWIPGLKKSKNDKSKKGTYDIIVRYH